MKSGQLKKTLTRSLCSVTLCSVAGITMLSSAASAQTEIHITSPKSGFPVAVARPCNAGVGDAGAGVDVAGKLSEILTRDLQIAGIFQILNPSSFVEAPGKCGSAENVAYSDWSVIGTQGLVKAQVSPGQGNGVEVRMYLHDVQQQRAVVGKQYQADPRDINKVAHKFANEIMRYFTGEPGPFGTKVAYISKVGRFKELFLMDLDGSNNQQLTTDRGLVLSPSWSPQADRIVYTSFRTKKPELYTMSVDGAAVRQLTKREGMELGAKFSPVGSSMIASFSADGITNLFALDLRGNVTSQLTSGGAIDVSPSFSPDGSKIAFCSNRGGGPQIYVMPSSGGAAQRISYSDSNYCTSPAWSPKGDKIAFVCLQGGVTQVFIAPAAGGQNSQLTYVGRNEDPNWSPDGRFLAFASTMGRDKKNLFVASLIGSGSPVQITFSNSDDSQPAWSPVVE